MQFNSIICFGEVLWDVLPAGAKPGGAPMNVAIHLKQQGLNPWLVSRTGHDDEGEKLRQFLSDAGINLRYIQHDSSLPTSKVLVHLDKNKNAAYEICEPVAWDNIQLTDDLHKLAADAGLLVFGSLAARNETTRTTLLQLLKDTAAVKFLDVNLRPPYDERGWVETLLNIADFIKLNDDELSRIAGWNNRTGSEAELAMWLSEQYNCPLVCVTRGAKGALLLYEKQLFQHPGFKVEAVDTVGAGDAFLAGLIAKLSEGKLPGQALEFACATGAFVASRNGAVPAYSPEDIKAFL
jgi:fructokinase